jgi:hypothetical protein
MIPTVPESAWDAAWIVAIATVVVAIANLVFLWLNARATRQFEERVQRTVRIQARIEDAYRDFVTMMHRVRTFATYSVEPTPGPPPDAIPDRDMSEAVGRIRTFGSDAVVEAAERWGELVTEVVDGLVVRTPDLPRRLEELGTREKIVRDIIRRELSA